jgi:hypothetical protein
MTRIADPVLRNISGGTLKDNMPFESLSDDADRKQVCYLEAFGRTLCGIAPWLELGADESEEGLLRAQYIEMALNGIANAVDPDSPDYLVFGKSHGYQALVDAAFFAHGLIRAPEQLWENLDESVKSNVITELKRSREIPPWNNNWLLFAGMVEAAILEFTGECDSERLQAGMNRFMKEGWYEGDGWYGDGPAFRMDYYNSFVIHPMLTDILLVLKKHDMKWSEYVDTELARLARFAEIQERLISPEGTYPTVGRSIVYRFGAFQALSQASLMGILPQNISPAQVRSALSAIIEKQAGAPETFDKNGWLKVGFAGSQIGMSEEYINTGSLYLCSTVFLPLGLSADNKFWSAPHAEWTNLKAWKGIDVGRDEAINN